MRERGSGKLQRRRFREDAGGIGVLLDDHNGFGTS